MTEHSASWRGRQRHFDDEKQTYGYRAVLPASACVYGMACAQTDIDRYSRFHESDAAYPNVSQRTIASGESRSTELFPRLFPAGRAARSVLGIHVIAIQPAPRVFMRTRTRARVVLYTCIFGGASLCCVDEWTGRESVRPIGSIESGGTERGPR